MPSAGVDGCCSTLYYHVKIQCNHLLERFRFPPDKKYGAYFLFHQELGTPTAPKLVFIGLLTVICWVWLPRQLTWPETPQRISSSSINKLRKMRHLKPTIKGIWASLTAKQWHNLITTRLRQTDVAIHGKKASTKCYLNRNCSFLYYTSFFLIDHK